MSSSCRPGSPYPPSISGQATRMQWAIFLIGLLLKGHPCVRASVFQVGLSNCCSNACILKNSRRGNYSQKQILFLERTGATITQTHLLLTSCKYSIIKDEWDRGWRDGSAGKILAENTRARVWISEPIENAMWGAHAQNPSTQETGVEGLGLEASQSYPVRAWHKGHKQESLLRCDQFCRCFI